MLSWLLLAGCAPSAPPNVLMVSIDTLRRDHVDRYATDGRVRMPFLSELLASGLVLDDHQQCANWTFASVGCTLTGQGPTDAGWEARIEAEHRTPLPGRLTTLAERLAEEGYTTSLVTPSNWLSQKWGTAAGYDRVVRFNGPAELAFSATRIDAPGPWLRHVHFRHPHATYKPPERYLSDLAGLPEVSVDLTVGDEHYDALDRWSELPESEQDAVAAHLRVRYEGETRFLDDELAQVWPDLEEDGWLDDTIVVIWTDHGEQFWERGHSTHAWNLGAEENDAILGFFGAGIEPRAHAGPTHGVDLLPTLLDLLALPGDEALPGYVVGEAPPDRPRYIGASGRAGTTQAVTLDGWKLAFRWEDGAFALYDRERDRAERNNLYRPDHPEVATLWPLLEARVEALAPLVPDHPISWP